MQVGIELKDPRYHENKMDTEISIREGEFVLDDRKVICTKCGNIIADRSEIFKHGEENISVFRNPSGIFFRLICFRSVRGCFATGDYTGFNTWFPGYDWSVAFCDACHSHLGWHYISKESSFWGLIADRISGV